MPPHETPQIVTNMSLGWGRDPAGLALGTERTGVSAALWANDREECQEVWSIPHPDEHIVSFAYGRGHSETFIDGRQRFARTLGPNLINLVKAGEQPRAVLTGRWRVLHLYIPAFLVASVVDEEGGRPTELELIDPAGAGDDAIERIGRALIAEMSETRALSHLQIDVLGLDLVVHLLRRWSNLAGTKEGNRASGGLTPLALCRVRERIEAELPNDLRLSDLADAAGLSASHFRAAFQQSTGTSPMRYVAERRVARAKELLAQGDLPLAAIALACGFTDQSHLTRRFREATGLTPKAWRDQLA